GQLAAGQKRTERSQRKKTTIRPDYRPSKPAPSDVLPARLHLLKLPETPVAAPSTGDQGSSPAAQVLMAKASFCVLCHLHPPSSTPSRTSS
ncbi:mCG144935, partial [Mus musculus]